MKEKKQGLTAIEVEESRAKHGENVLTPPRRPSVWKLYMEKYQDPMVRILLVAAVVSLVLAFVKGDFIETIGIIAAVILATTVGFYFERDAARKFDVLTQLGEHIKLAGGIALKDETYGGCQQNSKDDTHRLNEVLLDESQDQ